MFESVLSKKKLNRGSGDDCNSDCRWLIASASLIRSDHRSNAPERCRKSSTRETSAGAGAVSARTSSCVMYWPYCGCVGSLARDEEGEGARGMAVIKQ